MRCLSFLFVVILFPLLSQALECAAEVQPTAKPDHLDESQITPSLVERLKNIGYGSWNLSPPASTADLPLVLGALDHSSLEIKKWGCLAVEKMTSRSMFDKETKIYAIDAMVPLVKCENDECKEWATRGIAALSRSVPRFFPKEALQVLSETTITLLADEDGEKRRRAANLIVDLLPFYDDEQMGKAAIALLTAGKFLTIEKILDPNRTRVPSASLRALNVVKLALSRFGGTRDSRLADEIAENLIHAFQDKRMYADTRRAITRGLASFVPRLQGDMRKRAIDTIITSASDHSLSYSMTSGRYSPSLHSGAQALAHITFLLDNDMLKKAEANIPSKKDVGNDKEYQSMYGCALKAIAKRRQALVQPKDTMQNKSDADDGK